MKKDTIYKLMLFLLSLSILDFLYNVYTYLFVVRDLENFCMNIIDNILAFIFFYVVIKERKRH